MDFEKLYGIIHSLTTVQKRNFSRYTRDKRDTLVILLYQRILSLDSLSKSDIKEMKGSEFANPSTFYFYRDQLTELLFKSLIKPGQVFAPILQYIKLAVLFGADKIAKNAAIEEIKRLEEVEDFRSLRQLHESILRIRSDYNIVFELPQEANLKPYTYVKRQIAVREELDSIISNLQKVQNHPLKHWAEIGKEQLSRLQKEYGLNEQEIQRVDIESESKTNAYLRLKIIMTTAFLQGKYEESFTLGLGLIQFVNDTEFDFSVVQLAKDFSFIATNAVLLGNRSKANEIFFKVSLIEPFTPAERQIVISLRLKLGASLAMQFVEESVADSCLNDLSNANMDMDAFEIQVLHYAFSLTYFLNQNYSEAIRCISRKETFSSAIPESFSWESNILRAICHYELGEIEIAESHLRTALKLSKEAPLEYFRASTKVFKEYLGVPISDQRLILQTGLQRIRTLLDKEGLKEGQIAFPITTWIEAKLQNESLRTIRLKQLDRQYFQMFFSLAQKARS